MNRSIIKLQSSTEISPSESPNKTKTVFNYKYSKPSTNIMDPLIIHRVEEYMNEHKESRYLDIDEMVDELQTKYREYSRRKRIPFKSCVLKAFNIVMNDVDEPQTSDEADSDKDIDVVKVQGGREMYLKYTFNKKNKPREEKELIKISSDEEEKERPPRPVAPPPASTPISVTHVDEIGVNPAKEPVSGLSRKRKNDDPIVIKPKKRTKQNHVPNEKFADFGGLSDAIIKKVFKRASRVLIPETFKETGTLCRRRPGFLIYGPHGSGKTFFAHCLAGQLQLPLITVSELIGGSSEELERRIQHFFDDAEANAPCVLFFDNLDSLAADKDQTQRDTSRRIVAQITKCFDELGPGVAVVGATCQADSIDPALRRPGRLAMEVSLGMPNREQREEILKIVYRGNKFEPELQLSKIAELTPGFVACDLQDLAQESYDSAFERSLANQWPEKEDDHCLTGEEFKELVKPEEIDSICITQKDIESALDLIQPSALREGFITLPDVTWDDIGSLETVRNQLHHQIIEPIRNSKLYADLGLSTSAGLLLCGPPGCGKTLIAKAVAKQSGFNFISVKGPELLNMYLGESDRAVRQVFERARNSSPCILFFDEIDALSPCRGNLSNDASTRLITQMSTEMDHLVARNDVFVLAATNRPELVDLAILRPGRLDKSIFVDLPKGEDRAKILKAITRNKPPIESDVDFVEIAQDSRTEGYSGADLSTLVKEAASYSLSDLFTEHGYQIFNDAPKVKKAHFYRAFEKIQPSVRKEDYEKMKKYYGTYLSDTSPIFKDTQTNEDISQNLEN